MDLGGLPWYHATFTVFTFQIQVSSQKSTSVLLNRPGPVTYMVCPVLATWHKNCSKTGDGSFFVFLSKSEGGKNEPRGEQTDTIKPVQVNWLPFTYKAYNLLYNRHWSRMTRLSTTMVYFIAFDGTCPVQLSD